MTTRLENLTHHLQKAKTKPTYTLAQEMCQYILIMRLMTEIKGEIEHVTRQGI